MRSPRSLCISIHPPRAGRDELFDLRFGVAMNFNPPAPCGAGHRDAPRKIVMLPFQSTRPVRGGTLKPIPVSDVRGISIHPPRAGRDKALCNLGVCVNISIHPPRAGRDTGFWYRSVTMTISIHPPRAGRDLVCPCPISASHRFQSTRPVRGGTGAPNTGGA